MKSKLDKSKEKIIAYYETGKNDMWLADKFKVGERTMQRYLQQLREKKEIPSREQMKDNQKVDLESIKDSDFAQKKEAAKTKWTVSQSAIKATEKEEFKSYLIIADNHIPEHNVDAHKALFQLMDDVKFDGFIIDGDYMDMGPISHWNKHKKKTLEMRRMKEDYITGNAILDEFDKRLPKNCDKRFIFGNHEQWYYQLIEEMPMLDGLFHPTEELKLKERGYKVYEEENSIIKLGRLHICHGIYCPIHATHKHLNELKTNVLFAHTHRLESKTSSSPAKEISLIGYNIPCMCDKSPDYMKNKPNRWTHGFAIVHVFKDGFFDVDMKRIVKGRFVYNGKLYSGK